MNGSLRPLTQVWLISPPRPVKWSECQWVINTRDTAGNGTPLVSILRRAFSPASNINSLPPAATRGQAWPRVERICGVPVPHSTTLMPSPTSSKKLFSFTFFTWRSMKACCSWSQPVSSRNAPSSRQSVAILLFMTDLLVNPLDWKGELSKSLLQRLAICPRADKRNQAATAVLANVQLYSPQTTLGRFVLDDLGDFYLQQGRLENLANRGHR